MDAPLHSLEAHDVIAAELVACTLGQRQRMELRTACDRFHPDAECIPGDNHPDAA